MSNITTTTEKQTFRAEVTVDIDGIDTKFYAKCTVNYERNTYKATPILTLVHKKNPALDTALVRVADHCRAHCEQLLSQHRAALGLGDQSEFSFGDDDAEPAESN